MAKSPESDLFSKPPLPIAILDDASRLACLRLIRSQTVGPVAFRELINHYGGAQAALDALPEITAQGGKGRRLQLFPADAAERELEAAAKVDSIPVFTIEPGYPGALADVDHPPPLLYVRGDVNLLARQMIAIVGSRLSSAAGVTLTRQFASDLGQAGFVIASGLARGIDAAAHEIALTTGTVAVLAGGVDIVYPPQNQRLYDEIIAKGCVVSEMPPGHLPRAKDFPRRNRIISGISLAVLVIEAAKRSGTLITARTAAEQGREVFAVPGHPLDPRAEGTNQLLRGGATLATSASDIIDALGPMSGRSPMAIRETTAPEPRRGPERLPLMQDVDVDVVATAIGFNPTDVDGIVRATGLDTRAVQVALMELDLAGRIERHGEQLVSLRSQRLE